MRTRLRSKVTLLFMTCAVLLAVPAMALADDISNNLDTTVDAVAEDMPLTVGGANGTTSLYLVPQGGDGKNGCNLTGSTTLGLSVNSSNASVATVSPSSATFTSCGQTIPLTVTPHSAGTATISVSQTSNTTDGSFNLAPATFKVTVTNPTPSNTAPTVAVAGVTGGASYNKGSVPAATCQVTDAEDGNSSFPATLSAVAGPYSSDGIGEQTASCSYTDGGGLTASASETYNIVDPSGPVITKVVTPAGPDGSNGWYKSDVTVKWTVSDPDSPNSIVKTGCVDQNITADQDATEYTCSATSAGGDSGPESVTIKRDGSAPNAPNATTDPLNPVANSGGFFKDSVKVTYGGSTDVGPSGIADYTTDQTFSTTGMHDYSGTATDNAGNVSTATTGQVKVDADAPKVGITDCPTSPVLLHSTQNVTVAASDVGSGLVSDPSGRVALDTNSVGPQSKTITVEDKVGHTESATCSYSVKYGFSGFLQPINNTAHQTGTDISTFKAGSTVPVKFKLTDANGNTVQADSAQWITPQKGAATTQAVDEDIYSLSATTGGLYRWDATAQQYIYNWSTKGLPSGNYYKIGVKLDDGQTYYQNISLR